MTTFDFLVVLIISLCFLFSFYKGMVRELFSLFGYLAGYVLAMNYFDEVTSMVQGMASKEILARIAEFKVISIIIKILIALFIFFIVRFFFNLLGRLIRKSMEASAIISFPDRVIGGALGILKGLIIVVAIMFPLSFFQSGYDKVTLGSLFSPYLEKIIQIVRHESYGKKIFDKIPAISLDDIPNSITKMSDIEKVTNDIKIKKDEMLKIFQEEIQNENNERILEKYTEDDKNKLNELLETFSEK